MPHRTLKLNDKWDIMLTSGGRIAVADGAYATAQTVANAIRLFTRDAYLKYDRGIPHFVLDLGVLPSAAAVRSRYRNAALGVHNVDDAAVHLNRIEQDNELTGTVNIRTKDNEDAQIEI